MKLPLFSHMREAAQKLMNRSASATIQQAMDSLRGHPSMRPAAPAQPSQPTMRDINPPPRTAAEAAPEVTAKAAPETAAPPHSGVTPNPATHPA